MSESQEAKQTEKAPQSRTRSPGYPAISLKTSIERAAVLFENEQRNAAPVTSLAAHWGMNATSSSVPSTISALKKFGLVEETSGKLFKLTPLALDILLHEPDAPEREHLLKQAALRPRIHADLWDKYAGTLPS